jgi:hypothetical protein
MAVPEACLLVDGDMLAALLLTEEADCQAVQRTEGGLAQIAPGRLHVKVLHPGKEKGNVIIVVIHTAIRS